MDENEDNETKPTERLSAAEQDAMKAEGVEIEGEDDFSSAPSSLETPTPAAPKKIAPEPVVPKPLEPVVQETPVEPKTISAVPVTPTPIPKLESTPISKPTFQAQTPISVPEEKKYGSFTSYDGFTPIPRQSIQERPVQEKPAAINNSIKPIRTYRSDAEEAVEGNHTSVIDIAVAESKKKEKNPMVYAQEKSPRKFLWISVVFIIIALAVIGGVYYFWTVGSQTLQDTAIQSYYSPLITVDSTKTVPLDEKNPIQSIVAALSNSSTMPVGETVNVIPTGANGIAVATSSDFFSDIGITIPPEMGLSLDGTYTLGFVVSDPDHPFIVLGISSFENAFAGMLAWEKTMRNDFGQFITIDHPTETVVPTSQEMWSDTTIVNQDVREILDASSSPLLLYTFVGTTKLVITTDASIMSAIVEKLNTTNVTR